MMSDQKISLDELPSTQPQPGDPGYVPPAAAVPLPSLGLLYPVGHPLAGKTSLDIRAMTARDEDILTSKALIKKGKVIDALLRSCVLDRSIDVDGMLVGDRNAVLISIRITGYGSDYLVKDFTCPSCEKKSKQQFDLSNLPVKPLVTPPLQPGVNEFSFRLPTSRRDVIFKLMTGNDERDLSVVLEQTRKVGAADGLVTARLAQQIMSIDGERDRNKIAALIRNMPARDSRDLRKYIEAITPGVEMRQIFVCPDPECGETQEVDVPLGTEFFWPEA